MTKHIIAERPDRKPASENSKTGNKPKWCFDTAYGLFIKNFETLCNKKYKLEDEHIIRLKTMIYYVTRDNRFSRSPILRTALSVPSFKKGLLIIGDYGVGKTAFLKAMAATVKDVPELRFRCHYSVEVVNEYENLLTPADKEAFHTKYHNGIRCFDDLLSEKDASNYGKSNIMKDILLCRCNNNKITHIACNYDDRFPNDLEKALDRFAIKYNGQVYDRLFEMFNIIEFRGKSLRR